MVDSWGDISSNCQIVLKGYPNDNLLRTTVAPRDNVILSNGQGYIFLQTISNDFYLDNINKLLKEETKLRSANLKLSRTNILKSSITEVLRSNIIAFDRA